MTNTSLFPRQPLRSLFQKAVEAVLRLCAFYVIPVGWCLISAIALVFWSNQYNAVGDTTLELRTLVQDGAALTPATAHAGLQLKDRVNRFDTRLSEAPVWFSFSPVRRAGTTDIIEFPSRHAIDLACWNQASLQPLGASSRSASTATLPMAKAGFALKLAQLPADILCRASFVGPARLTVAQWPEAQFAVSVQQYHRKSGLLDGGMIVLALFVLVTALINRQALYVLFAGWLILNLRVAALSAGWDIQWLGQVVPPDWLLLSRAVTMALYGVASLTLFEALFRDSLSRTGSLLPMRVTQWCCLPLLVAAFCVPYRVFLPILWIIMVFGFSLMTAGLVTIMIKSRTRVAAWFAASFAVTFVASLAEVFSAAFGLHELLGVINSVTAALASSLLAALAVAEQMRVETLKRIEVQQQHQRAYEAMPVGLFTLDMHGAFLSANPALQKMLGNASLVLTSTRWNRFFADEVWSGLLAMVHNHTDVEMEIAGRDGGKCFLVRATLAHGRIEGVLQDTTEKTKANEQLRFMANNDPLTRVFNRRGIEKMFENAARGRAAGAPLTLAYLDLDRFKLINDLFGHGAGDEVLKQVCERIGGMLAAGQQIGRVGGDEFIILMPDTSIALASLICRGIVERIGGTPYRVGDKAFHVRVSIGLIEVNEGMKMKDAVSTADRACREAKSGGSAELVVYARGASAFHEREAELALVERLSGPEATDGMFLEMQPIMSLKAPHASLNFEVLLRMREKDGRIVGAGPIIGAAEKSGRAGVIDRWVLSTTLVWIETHTASLANTQFVCMNLSGASLNDERFVQDTIAILGRHVHAASRLCMEITESVALHDLDNTRRFIDQVRNFGVKIALDDFGAGYTSFSYLKELPADVLKIDGNFIVNINAHPANVAIVEAIVNLAVNLGMKTIAEWAEDTATVRTLAEIGVDYVQGFAVARSQSPERMLTAASSASFIQDEELALLAHALGAPPNVAATSEPVLVSRLHGLH